MLSYSSWRRRFAHVSLLALLAFPAVNAIAGLPTEEYQPFSNPLLDRDYARPDAVEGLLEKRQSCPSNYNSCSNLGSSSECCPSDNNCQLDQAGQIACCPSGAACTGTIHLGSTVTGTTFTTGSTTTVISGSTTSAATTTSGFLFPSTVTTTASASGTVTTVPNALYPFVYIPTSFNGASQCSSYYTYCESQFLSCTAYLGGAVSANAVTISGVTGLVTVAGATASLGVTRAASVCSSLSQDACYGLNLGYCSQLGTATTFVAGQTGAAVPRVTGCPGGIYAMGAGVALGVVGGLI